MAGNSARVRSLVALLYLCQGALGDIITTLPSIHFIKQTIHGSVDVCVDERLADIFAGDPHVDRTIAAPASWFTADVTAADGVEVAHLPDLRPRYDWIIDSMCTAQTARLIQMLKPIASVGLGFAETLHVYEHTVSADSWAGWSSGERSACDCFADVVRTYRDDYVDREPKLFVTSAAAEWADWWLVQNNPCGLPLVAINPGAGSTLKRWPMSRFIEVGRWLAGRGCLPLYTFGPKEASLYASHGQALGKLNSICYFSRDSRVQKVAALLQRCELTISNDCAVMHISSAVGTRTLGIFGPSNSRIWFPYRKPWNQVLELDTECRKQCMVDCNERRCMNGITVEQVVKHAYAMLDRPEHYKPATPSL